MIILHMLPLVQSLNNPFTKVNDNEKYYISTKGTNKAKFYMNTPHMLPEVRGDFKVMLTNLTDKTES